jgi:hypothetical protein
MKCAHPMCNRAIGLASHRRWLDKGLYCSRRCRDNYAAARPKSKPPLPADAKLFAWLLTPAHARAPRAVPAMARVRAPKFWS